MMQVAICGRASDVSQYCVNVQDIRASRETTTDGIPEFLQLTLRRWKGNENECLKPTKVILRRNRLRPDYCVVSIIWTWLARSGLTTGPLFPAMNVGHTILYEAFENTSPCYQSWLKALFVLMGPKYEDATSHSIRKSVVKWAARCGASPMSSPPPMRPGPWLDLGVPTEACFHVQCSVV